MANRTFLINPDKAYTDIPHGQESDESILCGCSNMIPLFWLLLFSSDDVQPRTAPTEDGDEEAYPVLQTMKNVGIERTNDRLTFVRENVPNLLEDDITTWMTFLYGCNGTWFDVETMELYWMEGDALGPRLQAILDAIDDCNVEVWRYINIQYDPDDPNQLLKASLFGYSWGSPVPWEQ